MARRPGERLTLNDLRALQPGDEVYVYYSEHGDDSPGRLDGVFKVFQTDSEMLILEDENGLEEFPWEDWDAANQHHDNGEGIAVLSRVRG